MTISILKRLRQKRNLVSDAHHEGVRSVPPWRSAPCCSLVHPIAFGIMVSPDEWKRSNSRLYVIKRFVDIETF